MRGLSPSSGVQESHGASAPQGVTLGVKPPAPEGESRDLLRNKVVSRQGLEPRTRRLREENRAFQWCPPASRMARFLRESPPFASSGVQESHGRPLRRVSVRVSNLERRAKRYVHLMHTGRRAPVDGRLSTGGERSLERSRGVPGDLHDYRCNQLHMAAVTEHGETQSHGVSHTTLLLPSGSTSSVSRSGPAPQPKELTPLPVAAGTLGQSPDLWSLSNRRERRRRYAKLHRRTLVENLFQGHSASTSWRRVCLQDVEAADLCDPPRCAHSSPRQTTLPLDLPPLAQERRTCCVVPTTDPIAAHVPASAPVHRARQLRDRPGSPNPSGE